MTIFETMKDTGNLLLESGIRIPKGAKAAKIVCHNDMDGFFSGLLTYHQLQKQGIPAKNITINFAQYGDDEKELIKKVDSKNKQFVAVVDFAALPQANIYDIINKMSDYKIGNSSFIKYLKVISKGNLKNKEGFKSYTKKYLEKDDIDDEELERLNRALSHFDFSGIKEPFDKKDFNVPLTKPDFISDHHQNEKGSLTKGKSGSIGKTEFGSDTEHMATAYAPNLADYSTIEAVTRVDSAKYSRLEDTLELPSDFKSSGRMERLAIIVNSLLSEILKRNKTLAVEIMKVSSPSLVNVYNNILKMGKYNDKQVEIYEEMSKDKPNWDRINSLRSDMPKSMAKETSKENLSSGKKLNTIENWREKGKEDIKNAKSGYWSKKDQEGLEKEQDGKPHFDEDQEKLAKSKLLVINDLKNKLAKMEKLREEGKETTYDPVGGSSGHQIGRTVSKEMFNKIYSSAQEHLKDLEDKFKKLYPNSHNKKDELKAKKESSKSQFSTIGNVMKQDVTATRNYPSRYTGSVLNKSGIRYPFILKRFSTMMQVAMNPDAKDLKGKVDLGKIATDILTNIKKKFGSKYNEWAFDVVEKESGGHAAITNISGLGTLGLMKKKDRDEFSRLSELKKRATAAGTSLSDIEKRVRAKGKLKPEELSLWQKYKALEEIKKFSAKTRIKIMDEIENEFYKELSKYSGLITKKQENYSKYDLNVSGKSEEKPAVEKEKTKVIEKNKKLNLAGGEPIKAGSGKIIIGKQFEESLLNIAGELII